MNYFKDTQKQVAELMIEAVRVQVLEKNKHTMSAEIKKTWSGTEAVVFKIIRFDGFYETLNDNEFVIQTYFDKKFSTYLVLPPRFEKIEK